MEALRLQILADVGGLVFDHVWAWPGMTGDSESDATPTPSALISGLAKLGESGGAGKLSCVELRTQEMLNDPSSSLSDETVMAPGSMESLMCLVQSVGGLTGALFVTLQGAEQCSSRARDSALEAASQAVRTIVQGAAELGFGAWPGRTGPIPDNIHAQLLSLVEAELCPPMS